VAYQPQGRFMDDLDRPQSPLRKILLTSAAKEGTHVANCSRGFTLFSTVRVHTSAQ
jgi:hypothetical protein